MSDPKRLIELEWSMDWAISGEDDEVLECGLENPEICESCQ
jgi:hypothetical protein